MPNLTFRIFSFLSLLSVCFSLTETAYDKALRAAEHIERDILPGINPLPDDGENNENRQKQQQVLITDTKIKYMEDTITAIQNYVDDPHSEGIEDPIFGDVTLVLTDLAEGLQKCIDDGDATKILAGIFKIVGSVASLAKYAGPEGALVGTIVTSLCSFASACLIEEEFKENEHGLVRKALRQELANYRKDEIMAKCRGKLFDAQLRLNVLSTLFLDVSQRDRMEARAYLLMNLNLVSTNDFLLSDSAGFLEELWFYIEKAMKVHGGESVEPDDKELAAHALLDYVILSHYRNKELTLLAGLYSAVGSTALGLTAVKAQKNRSDRDEGRMRQIFHRPDIDFYKFLQDKHKSKCEMINQLQPKSVFKGQLCAFSYDHFYYVKWSNYNKYISSEKVSATAGPPTPKKRFTIFKKKNSEGEDRIGLYSHGAGGFVGLLDEDITSVVKLPEYLESDDIYCWSLNEERNNTRLCWNNANPNKIYLTALDNTIFANQPFYLSPRNAPQTQQQMQSFRKIDLPDED